MHENHMQQHMLERTHISWTRYSPFLRFLVKKYIFTAMIHCCMVCLSSAGKNVNFAINFVGKQKVQYRS